MKPTTKKRRLTVLQLASVAIYVIGELFKTAAAFWQAARALRHNEKLFAKWDREREAERVDRIRHPERWRGIRAGDSDGRKTTVAGNKKPATEAAG